MTASLPLSVSFPDRSATSNMPTRCNGWTRFPSASCRTAQENSWLPDATSFQAAASSADWTTASDFHLVLTNAPGENAYPITATTFVLMHDPHDGIVRRRHELRVAIRQPAPGEARNVIAAMFGAPAGIKHVFVVDPDVDVSSDAQMDWALATRFQADRDLVVQSGFRGPSWTLAVAGRDDRLEGRFRLHRAVRESGALESRIPEVPKWQGQRFASIDAALDDGPKFFEELMVAVGSRDGREIVRELETIRTTGRLARDKDGRWMRPAK